MSHPILPIYHLHLFLPIADMEQALAALDED